MPLKLHLTTMKQKCQENISRKKERAFLPNLKDGSPARRLMKITVHDIIVECPEHGDVPFTTTSDLGGEVMTLYCPCYEKEAREQYRHPESPYPVRGTSPSVIEACNRGD